MRWLVFVLAWCSCLIAEEELIDLEESREKIHLGSSRDKILDRRENYFLTTTDYRITPKVNPITGEYSEEEVDLIVAGSQPVSLRRFYSHLAPYDPRYASWRYNPESFFVANLEWKGQETFAAIGDADGSICSFQRSSANYYLFNFQPSKGFVASGDGKTHPLNTEIAYWRFGDPKDKKRYQYMGTIKDGSGRVRSFASPMHRWTNDVHYTEKRRGFGWGSDTTWVVRPNTWTPYHIPIQEEKLPNGNILCYSYTRWKKEKRNYPRPTLLSGIVAYNSTKTKILGYINLSYQRLHGGEEIAGIHIVGSDGRQATIKHESIDPILLWAARRPDQPSIDYGFTGSIINRVEKPDGRSLTTEYNTAAKVIAQCAPVGPNGEMCPIGRYDYQEKCTIVYDAENNKTIYRYDENKKFTALEIYQGDRLYRTDRFTWDEKTGNLLRKVIEDSTRAPIQIIEYQYDKNHNPIVERIGNGKEWNTITRTFSEDGFNLKLSESDREGKKICYNYSPGTNLLISELIYAGEKIYKRTFHVYDDCAICIKTITDDGASVDPDDLRGVSYRKIIATQPKQSLPCFGLPEKIQEKTIDTSGQEILLKQVGYTYTTSGKILEEEHCDAEGNHCYSIHNIYDHRERLISTTDPLGHVTQFGYDRNNNLISITGPRPDQHKEITYDKANRPVRIADWQADGSILTLEKRYNKLGQVVAEIDACGNITRLDYDSLGRVIAVCYPDGAIERKEYDILGNAIKAVNGEGYETRTSYDFRGKPLAIHYPDNREESFTYSPTGQITTYIDKNGSKSVYRYDIFDNPIRVEVYSSSGELLKVNTSVYSPFCKLSETDGENVTATFTYDFCGRKIAEQKSTKKTQFFYDSLGRVSKTNTGDYATLEEHDHANQPILKQIKDEEGTLQFQERYTYDASGNRTHLTTSHGDFETDYNTFGKIVSETNPLGFSTTHEYRFGKEYSEIVTDANGIQTIHIYDSRGREAEVLKKNQKGEAISRCLNCYNKNGNLIETTHFVFEGTEPIKSITHTWEYGPMGRLERFVEAGEKETRHLYDSKGHLAILVKPSGIRLHYEWDDLGRLARYFSTDFDYRYTYDRNDRLVSVYDAVTKKRTLRNFDALGNVTQEILATGLKMNSSYDDQGRKIAFSLPDNSTIRYSYCGAYLYSVSHKGQTFTYQTRDLEGHLLQAELPNHLGTLSIERDGLSRWKTFHSPFYSSTFPKGAYDPVGNLQKYSYRDGLGEVNCHFTYDALDQLISENEGTYQFDSLFNRLKKDEVPEQVNNLCQLIDDGQTVYEYDKDGNLVFDGCWRYTYDTQDRLIAVEDGVKRIEYTYDPFHRRLSKQVFSNGKQIKCIDYIWEGENEIGAVDEQGNIAELRVLGEGLGAEIGAAILFELSGKTYVPIHDHRGCVVALADCDTGNPVEQYRYTAFGEELTENRFSPWLFASKRNDEETGLVFFGRRYYFPELGRWITQDPQGFEDGPNLYAYLSNCPLNRFDLYGLYDRDRYASQIEYNLLNYSCRFPHRNYWNFDRPYKNQSIRCNLNDFGFNYPEMPQGQIIFGNGMLNSLTDLRDKACLISQLSGFNTHCIYNASNGFFVDSREARLEIFDHAMTKPVYLLQEQWNEHFDKHPNVPLFQIGHSQSAAQIRNGLETYPKERRDLIMVALIAPCCYISPDLCMGVTHYVNDSDLVPLLFDCKNRQKYKETTVHIKQPPGSRHSPHDFYNPVYMPYIQQEITKYFKVLKDYGY